MAATLTAAFLGWMFDGLEMGIFPLVARPALQEFQMAGGTVSEQLIQHHGLVPGGCRRRRARFWVARGPDRARPRNDA